MKQVGWQLFSTFREFIHYYIVYWSFGRPAASNFRAE